MKKLILSMVTCVALLGFTSCEKVEENSTPTDIHKKAKVSVDIEFGSGPWCWLPGICSISVDVEWGVASNNGNGGLALEFTGAALAGKPHGSDIIGHYNQTGTFQVDNAYNIDPALIARLGLTQTQIAPGQYPMQYDPAMDIYRVEFQ